MRHVDGNRRRGQYCRASCFLCFLAAKWTLQGRWTEPDAILKAKPNVDVSLGETKRGAIGGAVSSWKRKIRAALRRRRLIGGMQ